MVFEECVPIILMQLTHFVPFNERGEGVKRTHARRVMYELHKETDVTVSGVRRGNH